MPKLYTPIKPIISNKDLMATLKSFKGEILSSQNSLSDLQASQYNDLKAKSLICHN